MRTAAFALVVVVFAGCLEGGGGPTPPPVLLASYVPDCSISNWEEPCLALASPNASPSKTEIDIVANPTDPRNVFVASKDMDRSASGCVWAIGQVSKDGGKTWTTSYVGGTRSQRQPGQPLYGWGCITDPIMAFDKDGWLYYALQAYNYGTDTNEPPNPCPPPVGGGTNSGSAFYLARSRDGGSTWDRIIPLHAGEGNLVFHDYPRMASNPVTGSTYVIWNQFNSVSAPCGPLPGAGNILPVLAGTRDRGENAIRPVYLTPANHPDFGDFGIDGFAISDAGTRGTAFVTLSTTKDDKTNTIWLVQSTDDANSFSDPRAIFEIKQITAGAGQGRAHTPTTRFRASSGVELAADNSEDGDHKGCLYAAYIDNGTGDWDVLTRRSCDNGRAWTEPVRVNQDTDGAYQFMTRIVVDDEGVVHVVYQTQAHDPGHKLIDAEYAFSEDGGANWTVRRITAIPSDGDLGVHQDGGPFFGDYNGIAASGTDVYLGFPHTATGVAEIAVAHVARSTQ